MSELQQFFKDAWDETDAEWQALLAKKQQEIEAAERDRRSRLQEAEAVQRIEQRRKEKCDLANILGWVALCVFFAGPLVWLSFLISGYFVYCAWGNVRSDEKQKGHWVGWGVAILWIGILCIMLLMGILKMIFGNY